MLESAVRLLAVEKLTVTFCLLLLSAGLVRFGALEDRGCLLLIALAGLVPLAVAGVRSRLPRAPRPVRVLLDFHIAGPILLIFENLGPLIRAVSPHDRDAWLIAADRFLFGGDPARLLARFATPALSDILTVCYALYFFHPLVLGGLLYADDLREGRCRFDRYAFAIVLTFYVSYAGYFILPAIGPRFTVSHAGPLPQGAISQAIDGTLTALEANKRDCFPSGHTMVVLAVLIEAARRSRKTFLAFLPFALGLIAATVYGRYHYAIDVLVGAVLGPLTLWLGGIIYDRCEKERGRDSPA